jgi:hypothetical protein
MPEHRQIRVTGALRADIEIELLTQLVIMLGRQLSQQTTNDGAESDSPPLAPPEEPA